MPPWNNSSLSWANGEQPVNNEQAARGSWVVLIPIQNPRQIGFSAENKKLMKLLVHCHHPASWKLDSDFWEGSWTSGWSKAGWCQPCLTLWPLLFPLKDFVTNGGF